MTAFADRRSVLILLEILIERSEFIVLYFVCLGEPGCYANFIIRPQN